MIVRMLNAVTDEAAKINNAETVQGEQSMMVQSDMKEWAIKEGIWSTAEFKDIVEAHAFDRGWLQKGFTGLETVDHTPL